MVGWLRRLFGSAGSGHPADACPTTPQAVASVARPLTAQRPAKAPADAGRLRPVDEEFLTGFLAPADQCPPSQGTDDDRRFLDGIETRCRARRLELPVLPQAAIRLRALLLKGDAPVGKYAELVEQDSALSVDVLTAANSMAYAGTSTVRSVHDAIVRIGMARLEGILLVSQLQAKVLRAGALQHVGRVLVELAAPLSHLASTRAQRRGEDPHVAFTRGTLWHVEHMVIVGAAQDIGGELRRALHPSMRALHQAFEQFGPGIRLAVAQAWGLEDLLIGGANQDEMRQEYAWLRRAILCRWLARDAMPVDGPDLSDLQDVLSDVPSRTS